MGISSALSTSLSGLKTTQRSVDVVAANVSNAENPDYTKKRGIVESALTGTSAAGVRFTGITRSLDQLVQNQMRNETSSAGQINVLDDYYQRLDILLGQPGSASGVDTIFNEFTSAIEALATTPASSIAQAEVITRAQVLTQTLNTASNEVQNLRTQAEQQISDAVEEANRALGAIEDVTISILSSSKNGIIPPDLLDQRDREISNLAEIVDLRIIDRNNGSIGIYTKSGLLLFDGERSKLDFDQRGILTPNAQYSSDESQRDVGTIFIRDAAGFKTDLIAGGHIRSGALSGYIELRDDILVETQTRLDELAENLALSLSDVTIAGDVLPAPVLGSDGIEVDLSGLQPGNKVRISYDDIPNGTIGDITLIHVTDPSVLPLSNDVTADVNDRVIGADLTNPADISTQLANVGIALSANAGAGNFLQILDDGAGATTNIRSVSAQITTTAFQNGTIEFPFFTDGSGAGSVYSGNQDNGFSRVGLAGRIDVNDALIADPTRLVKFDVTTAESDTTRVEFLRERLTETNFSFRTDTGLGGSQSPFVSTIDRFVREIVGRTANDVATASRRKEGQDIVLNGLQSRIQETSGVSIDEEIALLTELQAAYAANARVLTTAKELIDVLLQI